ncbi:imelysin family protein [Hylemonella gracilis]|uniref:Periplasmic lipoprotein-like protein n=1 Tax=Hylemonella gracilis ATCC 19624 TaxID=887062 RepID=F3KSM3_9BURK|nr:imelysin family protein [Hylemonella gracilis]EGI77092.1 periplasmic lipoprotein-like protein [Hylemonella gracilis ATCC 19624]
MRASACLSWLRAMPLACAVSLGLAGLVSAQTAPRLAFPYYTAEQALTGLYARQLPPRAQAFDISAQALVQATQAHCQGRIDKDGLHAQWQQTLLRWQALATPALGPLVQRRSQRQIDFWPVRPNLIDKALKGAPRDLADMARVGTPAKGFAGFEYLLAESPATGLQGEANRGRCTYALLVAQGIAAEARALRADFEGLAQRDWQVDEESADAEARIAQTRAAFAEWVNQWLGGLERLRWLQMEQPLVKAQTSGKPPAFARQDWADNLVDWRAQWDSLRAQALLSDPQAVPPVPGQAFVPIEALLYGKGQVQLAARWRQALTAADAALGRLGSTYSSADLAGATRQLKELTVLYQQQVAAALDVPLGFSDADGD